MKSGNGGNGAAARTHPVRRPSTLAAAVAVPMLLAGCSRDAKPAAILDSNKVGQVVIGRSSRNDVFAALGQPSRTERSALGEAWVYETRTGDPGSGRTLMNGVSAASGLVGAFVPYVGLLGSGLGLAGVAADGTRAAPQVVQLTVTFRDDSVVRDCTYASSAAPAGVPGSTTPIVKVVDCQRPPAPGGPRGL